MRRRERELEHYWFRRCKRDYGPIRWQGWAAVAAYAAIVAAAAALLAERTLFGFAAVLVVATASFLMVCHHKTAGGLRWHRMKGER